MANQEWQSHRYWVEDSRISDNIQLEHCCHYIVSGVYFGFTVVCSAIIYIGDRRCVNRVALSVTGCDASAPRGGSGGGHCCRVKSVWSFSLEKILIPIFWLVLYHSFKLCHGNCSKLQASTLRQGELAWSRKISWLWSSQATDLQCLQNTCPESHFFV